MALRRTLPRPVGPGLALLGVLLAGCSSSGSTPAPAGPARDVPSPANDGPLRGLMVGISAYGPRTAALLDRLARESGAPEAPSRSEEDALRLAAYLAGHADFPAGSVQMLLGPEATRARLMEALERLTAVGPGDPVLIYLSGETVAVDDPSGEVDGLAQFFLPHDVDLAALEDQLEPLTDPAARQRATLEFFQRQALPFEWLAATFRDRHSKEMLLILDCSFPGRRTGLRYAPARAAALAAAPGEPAVAEEFVKRLSWIPGRLVVLARGLGQAGPRAGAGFVHHLTSPELGAVPTRRVVEGERAYRVVHAREAVAYARSRIEEESGRQASVLRFGDNDDFPVFKQPE